MLSPLLLSAAFVDERYQKLYNCDNALKSFCDIETEGIMDRGRCFSMLGLSETATKEQVKAAYERKVAKYKGPDYAEERAYAERKLAQLYHAYQEAYEAAENGPGRYQTSRIERDAEKPEQKKAPKTNRLLEEERDAADHNKREKFHQWMERRDDEKSKRKDGKGTSKPKLEKPDFSKLKEKLQEIKEEVAAELIFSEEEEDGNAGMESLAKDTEAEESEFADFAKGCIYTEEETPVGRPIPQVEVDDSDNLYGADDTESSSESEGFRMFPRYQATRENSSLSVVNRSMLFI